MLDDLNDTREGSDKALYTISVAARLVDLHPQTLRYYERSGLLTPSRTHGRIRLYSESDVQMIRFIHRVVDELGVNLAGVQMVMQLRLQLSQLNSRYASELQAARQAMHAALEEKDQQIAEIQHRAAEIQRQQNETIDRLKAHIVRLQASYQNGPASQG